MSETLNWMAGGIADAAMYTYESADVNRFVDRRYAHTMGGDNGQFDEVVQSRLFNLTYVY